ncbi:MAG: sigma-70 family RNA polymerase sigma factor [Phycisphaerae bacterium]|nr:sigma-70 family RNA polymerase sigma factor [Phycisphaerae bacterium]
MLEDRLLVWKLRRGDADALRRIYEKHRNDLLRLAVSLSNDAGTAEDVVHDVFATFIRQARQFRLTGSLRAYLATCVANRARNVNRAMRARWAASLDEAAGEVLSVTRPDQWIVCSEELQRIAEVLAMLPREQREVITLHLQGGMKFREIAEFQRVPLKTAMSRYRCGLQRLRSLLNGEVTQCDR